MPIKNFEIREIMPSGSVYGAEITMKNKEKYIVDFNEIDGQRTL